MPQPLKTGDLVLDFVLPSLDGSARSLAEARGEGLVLFVFWKGTCGTCQYTFPYLQRFQLFYGGPGFRLWGIAQENTEDVRHFMREYGATFTQLIDEDLEVSERYDLGSVPALYLVDNSDRILRSVNSFHTEELNGMAKLIAERTGKPFELIVRADDGAPAIKPG